MAHAALAAPTIWPPNCFCRWATSRTRTAPKLAPLPIPHAVKMTWLHPFVAARRWATSRTRSTLRAPSKRSRGTSYSRGHCFCSRHKTAVVVVGLAIQPAAKHCGAGATSAPPPACRPLCTTLSTSLEALKRRNNVNCCNHDRRRISCSSTSKISASPQTPPLPPWRPVSCMGGRQARKLFRRLSLLHCSDH